MTFEPVHMIDSECKEPLQDSLAKYPQIFSGLGEVKNHEAVFHEKRG